MHYTNNNIWHLRFKQRDLYTDRFDKLPTTLIQTCNDR